MLVIQKPSSRLLLGWRWYKKPLSSSEFQIGLSPWYLVRQGQTRDHQWATKKGYLTDKANSWWQKDETRERSPTVNDGFENMAVLRRNYTNVYGHWKYFLPFFSSPWSWIEYCNSTHNTQTMKPVCTLMFLTMLCTTVWSIFPNYKCSNISVGSESVPHMRHMPHMRQQVE
jgi:hypothetical protein